jgi:crotonobetainyl-CoA:carnitine CoA-transferase CaiB-like acyl-CoA transferase
VLDLTRYIPGPFCTMILGDLGADVVKVEEPPIGDPTRAVPPPVGDTSAVYAALNRNKRSIVVDLRKPDGLAVLGALAAKADVLVEAFRPGVLERRGLGAERLLEANPRLVYCSITGYGSDGQMGARAGHDVNYIALGGLLGSNRSADGPPLLPTAQLADMTGGLVAAIGILAALQARERTGRGQKVDASLLAGVLTLMAVPAARLLAGGSDKSELSGLFACYNVYRCRDGKYLSVGALEPKFWEALCRALGHEDCINRQWERGEKAKDTIASFARTFAGRDRHEWLSDFADLDCCVEPVLELREAVEQPHVASALLRQTAGGDSFRTTALPFRLQDTPVRLAREAPDIGEHTDEVMSELGYAKDEVERLRDEGVVM